MKMMVQRAHPDTILPTIIMGSLEPLKMNHSKKE
jgi:hypothetical protein